MGRLGNLIVNIREDSGNQRLHDGSMGWEYLPSHFPLFVMWPFFTFHGSINVPFVPWILWSKDSGEEWPKKGGTPSGVPRDGPDVTQFHTGFASLKKSVSSYCK